MARLVEVAAAGEIPVGGKKTATVDDLEIAVFNVDDEQFYAVEDVCSHDSGPLGEGEVINTFEIECPRHGGRFDMRTGQALVMPAFEPIEAFPVVCKDGKIYIEIDW